MMTCYASDPDGWMALVREVRWRAEHVCEFCHLGPVAHMHHRSYKDPDAAKVERALAGVGPRDVAVHRGPDRPQHLMGVCEPCHLAIHQGGPVAVAAGSLALLGDTGVGHTDLWLAYLAGCLMPGAEEGDKLYHKYRVRYVDTRRVANVEVSGWYRIKAEGRWARRAS
jgi:hypothetical protein